jgi:hypothetical protein
MVDNSYGAVASDIFVVVVVIDDFVFCVNDINLFLTEMVTVNLFFFFTILNLLGS